MIPWLKKQSYRTKTGDIQSVTLDDILIVAPYNMQVNLLQKELSPVARVGTLDKFQGQEAEIVIVSMTTSSHCPGTWIFFSAENGSMWPCPGPEVWPYSLQTPRLLETTCNTVEQMGLINTLCRGYYAGMSDFRKKHNGFVSINSDSLI